MSAFASQRAREQPVRILSHVSFPGLGLGLDRDGQVVAAAGGLSGASVDDVVEAFGAHEDAVLEAEPAVRPRRTALIGTSSRPAICSSRWFPARSPC